MRASLTLLLAVLLASRAAAQTASPAVADKLPLDLAHLVSRADSFAVMVQGNQIGFIKATLDRTADRFTYSEVSRIADLVEQHTTAVFDATGAMVSVRQSGKVQGEPTSVELDYVGSRVKGKANTVAPDGVKSLTVDTVVAPGTLDDNAIQAVLPALPLGPGKQWPVGLFVGASNEYQVTTLQVAGTDRAVIGTDTLDTYRVEWSGVTTPTTFWVTTTAPHRILKIALAGAPIEIVRVGGRP
jgi:hypothetical protein